MIWRMSLAGRSPCALRARRLPGRAAGAAAAARAAAANSGLELIPLEIRSGGQVHRFTVEVAAHRGRAGAGLMYRESLGAERGMLFPFPPPRPAGFWMKNT